MPYGIRKTRKGCYSVYNKKTSRIFSKCTSKKMPINNLNYYVQSCSILISKSIQNLEEDEPFVREKYKFIYTYRQQ